ncbi:MAG: peptidase C15 [Heteroscytonema crispum UTEX LB 1556]
MKKSILLTSFDTWLLHQQSNSSDDLLQEVAKLDSPPHDLTFLRLLPVDVQLASSRVIEKIQELQPDIIICCGMAESRQLLSVEQNARSTAILPVLAPTSVLQTTVDLERLVAGGGAIEISQDCGKFVCEGLYFSVLEYLRQKQLKSRCIFVHVPVLNQDNLVAIFADFLLIIYRLALL